MGMEAADRKPLIFCKIEEPSLNCRNHVAMSLRDGSSVCRWERWFSCAKYLSSFLITTSANTKIAAGGVLYVDGYYAGSDK